MELVVSCGIEDELQGHGGITEQTCYEPSVAEQTEG